MKGVATPMLKRLSLATAAGAAMLFAVSYATAARPATVDIKDFKYGPPRLTVAVGTRVTWTNHDEEPHTVAATGGSFHSPGMGTNGTYSFTFTTAGTFDYICSIHPFMHGTVVVTP